MASYFIMYLLERAHERDRLRRERRMNRRRRIRATFNQSIRFAISVSDVEFKARYGLSRVLFEQLCQDLVPLLPKKRYQDSTDPSTKVLVALSFYARGCFQVSQGQHARAPIAPQTASQYLREVTVAINNLNVVHKYIRYPRNETERNVIKNKFYERYKIPGVVGCIDGTNFAIIRPNENEHLYYNRRNFYSINAQVICDADCVILHVNTQFGGGTRDAFIWSTNLVKAHLETLQSETAYLLGDAGYPLRKYMLTPIAKAEENSPESRYNTVHKRAYSTIQRTIDILRGKWKCLTKELQYEPAMASRIIIACCVLHNMCVKAELGTSIQVLQGSQVVLNPALKEPAGAFKIGQRERERVVQLLARIE